MKKNTKRDNLGRFTKNRSEFSFVNLATYTSPEIVEVQGQEWVKYGADNNYFQFLIDRFNGSPTNNACINGISQQIYGKGINATDSSSKPNEYAQMITLLKPDMVQKVSYDLKLMGQAAIQVIYSKDRTKIAQCEHFPIETLRAEKANDDGEITAYYYWNDWTTIKPSDKPLRIPAFGFSKENIEIYYIKPYKSGFYYYSPVDYQGGLQYAELEEEISNYHLNNIMNGLAPSMLINFNNGTPNQEQRELIEQRITQKFSGSSNSGKFILAFNDNKESQAEITPVQLSDAHQQYQFLSTESQSKILVSHRVVSPMLLGIKDSTGLGNNADEIKTASLLMDNTVIRPFQELLIKCFDQLLAYNQIALNLYFIALQPLEFTMPCENHEMSKSPCWDGYQQKGTKMLDGKEVPNCVKIKSELSDDEVKVVLGSLGESATKLSESWVQVDELDEDAEYSNEDWASYLIKEKKSTLSKIKELVGLKSATEENVGSVKDGSAFSSLDSKNGLYKIRYKYARGKKTNDKGEVPKSRPFCEEMMRLSNSGLVWRLEDIDNASFGKLEIKDGKGKRKDERVNTDFRHEPSLAYNIFTLKGGIYCYHKWVRVLFRLDSNTEASENLGNYKRTRTIPKSYLKNPRGSSLAKKATIEQDGKGAYPQ